MKKLPIFTILVAVCAALLGAGRAGAQAQVPPTPQPVPRETARFAADYVRKVGANATLFYGKHQAAMPNFLESMYLRDRNSEQFDDHGFAVFPRPVGVRESYAVGDIFYDGVLYPGVSMRLDLHRDQMVVAQPGKLSLVGIVLDAERFGWADLRGYRVIHLPAPVTKTDIPGGYYLQLNDGPHRVLKKERFALDVHELNFTARTIRYYVEKDGVFHNVKRTKGSVLRLLREHRGELGRFVRERRIRMRQDTERGLVEIVEEYERLTEQVR